VNIFPRSAGNADNAGSVDSAGSPDEASGVSNAGNAGNAGPKGLGNLAQASAWVGLFLRYQV